MPGLWMKSADAIVVGGGIAGLSLAARLALATSGATRVVVLEAEAQPGYHASGRSVAFAHFGLGDSLVRALTAASLNAFRAMIGPSGAPIAQPRHALHIARKDEGETFKALVAVHERFCEDFEILTGEAIRRVAPALNIGPDAAYQAIHDRASLALDTSAMLQKHVVELRSAGGELVTGARVHSLERTEGEWSVETSSGRFRAPLVVNAAGAWADEIARLAGVSPIGLEPRRRTVIRFAAPEGHNVTDWPFIKTVGAGFYLLPEGRSRLLASYMDETPSAPCDAAPEELDKAIAADRIVNAAALTLDRIDHSWAGLRTFARDERPVVGFAKEAQGFFWFAGQGGYGFQTSPALSQIALAAILGEDFPAALRADGVAPEALSPARFRA